jgi:hypothetical protein
MRKVVIVRLEGVLRLRTFEPATVQKSAARAVLRDLGIVDPREN